jgi:phosphoglycerate dehydrogenase-like enzyme
MRAALLAAAASVLTQALQPTVLVTDGLAPCGIERLAERGAKVVEPDGSLRDALSSADAVIVRSATTLTAELIAEAPSLRCIGRAGVGLDNIDLDAASKRSIPVVTSAGASTRAVSELCMALTQRQFLKFSELQIRVDGVGATSRHRDAVDVAVRESTRLVWEPRPCRDAVVRRRPTSSSARGA